MLSRLAAVALGVALLAAGAWPAAAGEPSLRFRTERHMSEFAPDALPTNFSPYHSMRADAVIARALEFFGDARGFALGDDWMLFEVEGGAALRLLDHMRLTASYRMLDVNDGQSGGSSVGLDAGLSAPFLGLALDF